MKARRVMSTIRAGQVLLATALFGVGFSSGAQMNGDLKAIALSNGELPGYALMRDAPRDWALFTAESGAPAPCLQAKPIAVGTEQLWRRVEGEGRLRIDYALLSSPGEAIAAANTAALLLNNATAKIEASQTLGDSSWRTIAGSSALIVQRGAAVIYLAAQGAQFTAEGELRSVAGKILERIDRVQLRMNAEKLACDIQVYLGLNLIHSDKDALQRLARDLERGGASARNSLIELKTLANAQGSAGMEREAAINLLRGTNSVAETLR